MSTALLTGVSGLIAHQRMLDVVGNNLANLNTTAYKGQRILFSDLLYTTIRPAATASNGDIGGSNPAQIGSGVKVSQVDRRFSQGNLEPTGGQFDFGIQGEGFFVVNDGNKNQYTRAGAFALDESGRLIDPSNGYRVLRTSTLGEPDGVNPGFQVPGDDGIFIPFGTTIPGSGSTVVELSGNLDSQATEALAEKLSSAVPYTAGGAAATMATLLNDLDSSNMPYIAGDSISISGTDVNGTPVTATLAVDGTTTFGDLVNTISTAFSGATAGLDALGNLVLEADMVGPATLGLNLANGSGNTGSIDFGNHVQQTLIKGKSADKVKQTIQVFDERGAAHNIHLTFTKVTSDSWDMAASIEAGDGTMTDGLVQQIQFNDNGSMQQVLGTGIGDSNITIQFAGLANPQTIDLKFGSSNSFNGLTHLAANSALKFDQDGFSLGTFTSTSVTPDGVIEGVATNGRRFPIAQLAMASFQNPKGLHSTGSNYYEESPNSGSAEIASALSGIRGSVRSGELEASNVDIAFEFTRLIVAQRGFSANARTITVTDQVLEELTNLIR